MMALALLAEAVTGDRGALTPPEYGPMHEAVRKCDRDEMGKLNKVEPHRRAEYAGAVYAEQAAIAQERANLDSTAPTSAAGKASLEAARSALESRQKRLDDFKLVEKAWRDAVEEMRADYLANCDLHHHG
jgi:hypothetical protein